jgi:hypothetical protein
LPRRGFLLRTQRNKADLVRLTHLFKRPANARIARQARAAIGRPFKSGDDDGDRESPHLAVTVYAQRPDPLRKLIAAAEKPMCELRARTPAFATVAFAS